jgi:hypothetical protein
MKRTRPGTQWFANLPPFNMQTAHKNIISDIFLEKEKLARSPMDLVRAAQRIVEIYETAGGPFVNAQHCIDGIVFSLCGKSLKDILEDYERPEKDIGQSGTFNAP